MERGSVAKRGRSSSTSWFRLLVRFRWFVLLGLAALLKVLGNDDARGIVLAGPEVELWKNGLEPNQWLIISIRRLGNV